MLVAKKETAPQTFNGAKIDYTKISDVELDGINRWDAMDYADAFISSASYDGREMSDAELDELNENSDYIYNCVMEHLY